MPPKWVSLVLEKAEGNGFTKDVAKRMIFFIIIFACIFVGLLAALQVALKFVGVQLGVSVYEFYPMMAGLGAVVGFERWWGNELGEYNPFHDD